MTKAEEKTATRDFVMARLAACRGAVALAAENLDMALALFLSPDSDPKGKERAEALEAVDEGLGEAAWAVQSAQELLADIDPEEGEPEQPEDEDEDEDEE